MTGLPPGDTFTWDPDSTYVRKPPYFHGMQRVPAPVTDVSGARVLGPSGLQARRGVVSFTLDGVHPHDLCQFLDDRFGVALRGGHHCAQPLMRRFGLAGTSRASLAPYNTDADVDALLKGVAEARKVLT